MQIQSLTSLWSYALAAVVAGAGAFFGSFLRQKGKGWARQQDLLKVDNEVKQITKTTEKIKAEIGEDVWLRQRRWEMRREAAVLALKRVNELRESFSSVCNAIKELKDAGEGEVKAKHDQLAEARIRFTQASEAVREVAVIVQLAYGTEEFRALMQLLLDFGKILSEKADEGTPIQDEESSRWIGPYNKVITMLRTGVTVIGDSTPQPT